MRIGLFRRKIPLIALVQAVVLTAVVVSIHACGGDGSENNDPAAAIPVHPQGKVEFAQDRIAEVAQIIATNIRIQDQLQAQLDSGALDLKGSPLLPEMPPELVVDLNRFVVALRENSPRSRGDKEARQAEAMALLRRYNQAFRAWTLPQEFAPQATPQLINNEISGTEPESAGFILLIRKQGNLLAEIAESIGGTGNDETDLNTAIHLFTAGLQIQEMNRAIHQRSARKEELRLARQGFSQQLTLAIKAVEELKRDLGFLATNPDLVKEIARLEADVTALSIALSEERRIHGETGTKLEDKIAEYQALSARLANAESTLREAKDRWDSERETLEARISQIEAEMAAATAANAQGQARAADEHMRALERVASEHASEMEALAEKHAAEIERLSGEQAAEKERLSGEHAAEKERLKAAHRLELERLNGENSLELARLRGIIAERDAAIRTLQTELQAQDAAAEEREAELRRLQAENARLRASLQSEEALIGSILTAAKRIEEIARSSDAGLFQHYRDILVCSESKNCHPAISVVVSKEIEQLKDHDYSVCFGALVDEDLLLTAAHCVPADLREAGAACQDRMAFAFPLIKGEESRAPFETAECDSITEIGRYESEHIDYDYAFIRLKQKLTRKPLRFKRAGIQEGKDYFLLGGYVQRAVIPQIAADEDSAQDETTLKAHLPNRFAKTKCEPIHHSILYRASVDANAPVVAAINCQEATKKGTPGSVLVNSENEIVGLTVAISEDIHRAEDYFEAGRITKEQSKTNLTFIQNSVCIPDPENLYSLPEYCSKSAHNYYSEYRSKKLQTIFDEEILTRVNGFRHSHEWYKRGNWIIGTNYRISELAIDPEKIDPEFVSLSFIYPRCFFDRATLPPQGVFVMDPYPLFFVREEISPELKYSWHFTGSEDVIGKVETSFTDESQTEVEAVLSWEHHKFKTPESRQRIQLMRSCN